MRICFCFTISIEKEEYEPSMVLLEISHILLVELQDNLFCLRLLKNEKLML